MPATISEIYVSVDVETAGPMPPHYSLLALGASVVGEPDCSFYAEFQPLNDNAIPEALAVNGFSLAQLAQHGEPPTAAMRRFHSWITSLRHEHHASPVFVAFNAPFDWAFINWYFHTFVGENPFGFSGLDIKAYYMGFSGCRWDETSSSKLPEQFQATDTHANHNALTDAKAQAEMFSKMLAASRLVKGN